MMEGGDVHIRRLRVQQAGNAGEEEMEALNLWIPKRKTTEKGANRKIWKRLTLRIDTEHIPDKIMNSSTVVSNWCFICYT